MVVCNVERFLGEAIASVLAQSFREFEFVIVDFGSTDKSKQIVSQYAATEHRIRLHEIPNCGLAEARNAGVFRAQGQYVAIMDADDVSLPDRLLREVEFLEKNPKVGVVGGAVAWIDATGSLLGDSALPKGVTLDRPLGNDELQRALLKDCPIWQPSVMMRKEAFERVHGYRAPFAPTEDYDLWLRVAEHYELANLKEVILHYRIHPHQVSIRRRKQQTFGTLAALASAKLRREGNTDPFDSVKEITPEILARFGISETKQQSALAIEYRGWIHSLCGAGEWNGALNAGVEMLNSSDWKHIERRTLADMHLEVADLYWKNQRYWKGIMALGRAVVTRPRVAGRPLRRLLHRDVVRTSDAY
jgi:glycosyltransferase involved in cell wall biosynthesis